jgi:hypothetical protein
MHESHISASAPYCHKKVNIMCRRHEGFRATLACDCQLRNIVLAFRFGLFVKQITPLEQKMTFQVFKKLVLTSSLSGKRPLGNGKNSRVDMGTLS